MGQLADFHFEVVGVRIRDRVRGSLRRFLEATTLAARSVRSGHFGLGHGHLDQRDEGGGKA